MCVLAFAWLPSRVSSSQETKPTNLANRTDHFLVKVISFLLHVSLNNEWRITCTQLTQASSNPPDISVQTLALRKNVRGWPNGSILFRMADALLYVLTSSGCSVPVSGFLTISASWPHQTFLLTPTLIGSFANSKVLLDDLTISVNMYQCVLFDTTNNTSWYYRKDTPLLESETIQIWISIYETSFIYLRSATECISSRLSDHGCGPSHFLLSVLIFDIMISFEPVQA